MWLDLPAKIPPRLHMIAMPKSLFTASLRTFALARERANFPASATLTNVFPASFHPCHANVQLFLSLSCLCSDSWIPCRREAGRLSNSWDSAKVVPLCAAHRPGNVCASLLPTNLRVYIAKGKCHTSANILCTACAVQISPNSTRYAGATSSASPVKRIRNASHARRRAARSIYRGFSPRSAWAQSVVRETGERKFKRAGEESAPWPTKRAALAGAMARIADISRLRVTAMHYRLALHKLRNAGAWSTYTNSHSQQAKRAQAEI